MIIVVEVPHRLPAFAWAAHDYVEACEICAISQPHRGDQPEGLDRAALGEWLSDNHANYVIEDAADARLFFKERPTRHQWHKQAAAVRGVLRQLGRGCLA